MRKYEKYKESGIEWITKIPQSWDKLKIGRAFNKIGSGTTPNTSRQDYYEEGNINWLNTGDLNDSYIYQTNKKINKNALNEISTLREFQEDSIVIALYGATIGKLGHLKIKTTTNQACCVLSDSEKIINRFLFYFFLNAREFIISKAYGGGQPNISQELIKQLYIPTPSVLEQTQIARYLDHQTGIIDALISKKEKLVELLKEKRQAIINEAVTKGLNPDAKMKDSSIKWLGEVPEDWEVSFLKRFCLRITDGAHFSPQTEFDGRNYISVKDVDEFGNIDLINCKKISDTAFDDLVKNGCQPAINDVLLTKDGTIGRAAVVKKDNDFVALSSLGIITPNHKILNSDYLRLFLVSGINVKQMYSLIAGAALTRLTIEKMRHLIITIPPIKEQREIVLRLLMNVEGFDESVYLLYNQIEKLKEYRQSIISEAVTGKVDVREWQPGKKQLA